MAKILESHLLGELALEYDAILTRLVESGSATSYSEAIEQEQEGKLPSPEVVSGLAALCDSVVGITAETTSNGQPQATYSKRFGEQATVAVRLFNHPAVEREYLITWEGSGNACFRPTTILIIPRGDKPPMAVNEHLFAGRIYDHHRLSDANIQSLQAELFPEESSGLL